MSAEAAAKLTQAMAGTSNPRGLWLLAQGLSALAVRLEPGDAAEAAAKLTQAMASTSDPNGLWLLAQGLSALAARLEPGDAAEAAAKLTQAMASTSDPVALMSMAKGLSALAARLKPEQAARLSAEAAAAFTQAKAMNRVTVTGDILDQAPVLAAMLGDDRRAERVQAVAATAGCLHACPGPTGALALLLPAAQPFPRRLSDQELVDLLKLPFFVGDARRAVLDHLGCRYGRAFADQWDFVRFAEERKLGLDFNRPPSRP